ncbi:uncharacterized protein LOC133647122 [Entelurus aequoreus]|uniref:uncharacterized protein LOC133647122 n=1 Tax=Entelurus aequoreus TaxID=161455 RepID=UPI002B1D3FAF|nr:uncharacterized protein LOC133647122 [Entelurus aequoreus]
MEQQEPHSPHLQEEKEELQTPHFKVEDDDPQPPHFKEEEEESQTPRIEDIQSLHVKEEQEDPQPSDVKEEEEEQRVDQEGEHLEWLQEFRLTGVLVKGEDDQVEKREVAAPSSSSTQDGGGADEVVDGTKMQRFSTQQALEMLLSNVNPVDSDGEDINLQEDSDSELSQSSSDEETAPQPTKRARLGTDVTETAKDGTVWHEEQVGTGPHFTPPSPYSADGEPTAKARRSITSRLQSFLCFITLDMLGIIRDCTVQHAKQTEHVDWFMGLPELMAFISITMMRGIIRVPSLRDCWSKNLGSPQIIETMSRGRFQNIMHHLRFDDRDTRSERAQTDKFAAISNIWGLFATNCITSYIPGQHITIDQQLFPSKTRCCFLQYIASKPDKFGIKFWVARDLKTKYVCNILPYLGKDDTRPRGERVSESVVMRLMEPFLDKGRNVTTDNFFTSLSLAKRLLSRNTTILGTVNKIRKEIPPSTRQMYRDEFTTQVFSTTGASLTVYAPKRRKTVYVLSSMHSTIQTQDTTKKKPNTITQYNTTKCGVDVMDQMVRGYTVRAGTRRWPVAVFYNMIDIAALNAHVLYQLCTGRQERRVDFLLELAKELAHSHVGMKKAQKEQLFRQQRSTPQLGKRAKCQAKIQCKDNRATVRCVDCYRYTCGKCRKEQWQCQDCE